MRFAIAFALVGCLGEPNNPPPATCHQARRVEPDSRSLDYSPWLSDDRDELLFTSSRAGMNALFRATRPSPDADFVVEPVPFADDTTFQTFDPFVLDDLLYFVSGGGDSGGNVYTTPRTNGTFHIGVAGNLPDAQPVFPELLGPVLNPTLTTDLLTIVYVYVQEPQPKMYVPHAMMGKRDSTKAPFISHDILKSMNLLGVSGPVISRDGQSLAFAATMGGAAHSRVYTAKRAGDDFTLTGTIDTGDMQSDDNDPYIHPAGRTMVFQSSNRGTDTMPHIWIYCE